MGLSLGLQSRSIHFSTPARVADTQGLGMSWTSRSIPELRLVCKTNDSCWGGLRAPEPPSTCPIMCAGGATWAELASAAGQI